MSCLQVLVSDMLHDAHSIIWAHVMPLIFNYLHILQLNHLWNYVPQNAVGMVKTEIWNLDIVLAFYAEMAALLAGNDL